MRRGCFYSRADTASGFDVHDSRSVCNFTEGAQRKHRWGKQIEKKKKRKTELLQPSNVRKILYNS